MSKLQIQRIKGRAVWDSRGRPTVECEVTLAGGAKGRAIAPAGASTGAGEAVDLRDGGTALAGMGVERAVRHVDTEIHDLLRGREATDQRGIDHLLITRDGTPNKARLGGNATIATSMAVAHAAAAGSGLPLWRYLGAHGRLPLPQIQIFGGGAHAGARVDIQDFMVIAVGADDYRQALAWTSDVYRAAGELLQSRGRLRGVADEGGWWPDFDSNEQALQTLVAAIERAGLHPGEQMAIALDIAATQLGSGGRYRLSLDQHDYGSDELADLLLGWLQRYPIVSIEDPLGEDDTEGFVRFTAAAGRVAVVGDDYLVTSADRVRASAARGACNTLLVKPNQAGTLTEAREALEAARAAGFGAIVSARSGETEDVTIVHLAVGWDIAQLKVGSFSRSERMAKWNEGLRIGDALGGFDLPPATRFAWGPRR